MTFAEYNTDEYFNNADSTADGLIKAAFEEGKTRDEVENSLSPLWKADKKGNVKKALDTYYKAETAPKTEEKEEEKTETVKTQNDTTSKIDTKDKKFLESENAIADTQEDAENSRQKELEEQRWNATYERMQKQGEAFRNIDDHAIEALPTFMFRRYQNGEFGDTSTPEGKKDAKLRMAYFMINGVGTALQNASAAIKGGQMKESDYEKFKNTNMAQGLENRWNKNKQETQAAIDLAKQEGTDEQDLQSSIAKISSNNRLNTAFNMMNESQKVYTLQVLSKIGNEIGNMNNKDFVNTLIGFATSGDNLSWQEAAELLLARFGKDAMGIIGKANEDGVSEDGKPVKAGIGGNIGNNLKGYQSINGETIDFSFLADDEQKAKLRSLMDDLSNRYYNGEIDEETFKKYYDPLYGESKKHTGTGSYSSDAMIKRNRDSHQAELNEALNELNEKANNGVISPSDYAEQFDNIKANLKKWGLSESSLNNVEKNRISTDKILKAVEKANKKKKK